MSEQINVAGQVNTSNSIQVARFGYLNGIPVLQYDPVSGREIDVVARMPWAAFVSLTKVNLRDGAMVRVIDVHGYSGCGGALFIWDAIACRFGQVTAPVVLPSLAAALAVKAVLPGLQVSIPGITGILKNNGTRFTPVTGRVPFIDKQYGTPGAPTKNSGTGAAPYSFDIGAPTFEANLFGAKSRLFLKGRFQRHNGGSPGNIVVAIRLGTAGNATDKAIWSATMGGTDLLQCPLEVFVSFPNATTFISNGSNGQAGTGIVSSFITETTNVNTASPMILSCDIVSKVNVNDTLDLIELFGEWSEAA